MSSILDAMELRTKHIQILFSGQQQVRCSAGSTGQIRRTAHPQDVAYQPRQYIATSSEGHGNLQLFPSLLRALRVYKLGAGKMQRPGPANYATPTPYIPSKIIALRCNLGTGPLVRRGSRYF